MAEDSAISWTDDTFNPWWGCDEVSPACDHCYARELAARFGLGWGVEAERRFFGEKHWNDPVRWNRKAEKEGRRRRVFCASMADVFELLPASHPSAAQMDAERARLWKLIEETPMLDWLLLTKRPKYIMRMLPERWRAGCPENVWMGTTAENQEWFDARWGYLKQVPAKVRFLSCEPMTGPIDLSAALYPTPEVHWIIGGGESGPRARPHEVRWFTGLRDQCIQAGVAYHFKQHGNWVDPESLRATGCLDPSEQLVRTLVRLDGSEMFYLKSKKKAGRLLDGRAWDEFPVAA